MELKKLFFPIGGGEELRERIRGALLVNKFFGTHLTIMAAQLDPKTIYNVRMTLKGSVLLEEFLKSANEELEAERENLNKIFTEECERAGLEINEDPSFPNSAKLKCLIGTRSELVEKHSKYCDLVIASVPPTGVITGTFESAVVKSGKSCIVIPRVMDKFKADKILLSLSGTAASARALTNSIFLLKKAKIVHCIIAKHYLADSEEETVGRIRRYLSIHGIENVEFECLNTEGKVPGQTLVEHSSKGEYDLIVAGMHTDNGIKEMFLGGASKYFLKNTKIPVFM
ncbi:MAG: universal stress protein [Campylobacter sp.]|nr:universal stress protein [Campylobacter sp.]MBP5778527.1 universal stress protein [Campylobacter sp.]